MNNLSDAWTIVDLLKEQCEFFTLDYEDGEWHCEFGVEFSGKNEVSAETAPMAICLASLKLLGI